MQRTSPRIVVHIICPLAPPFTALADCQEFVHEGGMVVNDALELCEEVGNTARMYIWDVL